MTARIAFSTSVPAQRRSRPGLRLGLALIALAGLTAAALLVYPRLASRTSASSANADEVSKLATGTLDLEDTDQAINSAQAGRLLPLWQLLDELQTNPAASPAETAAVVEAIRAEMSTSQLQSIQTVKSASRSLSSATGNQAAATSVAASDPMLMGAAGGSAMAFSGGGPMGGPGPDQAASSGSTTSLSISEPTLISQVIKLLESKVQD